MRPTFLRSRPFCRSGELFLLQPYEQRVTMREFRTIARNLRIHQPDRLSIRKIITPLPPADFSSRAAALRGAECIAALAPREAARRRGTNRVHAAPGRTALEPHPAFGSRLDRPRLLSQYRRGAQPLQRLGAPGVPRRFPRATAGFIVSFDQRKRASGHRPKEKSGRGGRGS